MTDEIIVSTDGSALANPHGPMGWAWADHDRHAGGTPGHHHDGHGYGAGGATNGTNQIGELCAVLEALRAHPGPQPLLIESDSQYAINCATKWVRGWKRNGWRNAQRKPVKNAELIRAIDAEMTRREGPVRFRWVKGHAGNAGNELVDELARTYAADCRSGARDGLLPWEGWQSLVASDYADGLDVPPDVQLVLDGGAKGVPTPGGGISSTASGRADDGTDATDGADGTDATTTDAGATDTTATVAMPRTDDATVAIDMADPEATVAIDTADPEATVVIDAVPRDVTGHGTTGADTTGADTTGTGTTGTGTTGTGTTGTGTTGTGTTGTDDTNTDADTDDADADSANHDGTDGDVTHGTAPEAEPKTAAATAPEAAAARAVPSSPHAHRLLPSGLTVSGTVTFSPAPRTSPRFTGDPLPIHGVIEVDGLVDGDGTLVLSAARFLRD